VTVSIDELGPVDWIVVEFPGTRLTGEIAPVIKDYVDRDLIKVLDLVFLKKDEDGSLEAFEASDLGVGEIGELRGYERDLAMLLREQDVADLAETIEPPSRPMPGKEPDMPLAARRRRRTVAAVGGAVVVAHGINRRGDRREDRRDDRDDRRDDRRDR
jgi:hypothetical protein